GIDLLNLGFSKIFTIVMQYPDEINAGTIVALAGQIVNSPGILFKIVGILVVYTFITVAVVNMCFSTIYLLYSEVMKAANILAPATGLEKEQLEGVKSGVTEAAQSGSSALKAAEELKGAGMRYGGSLGGGGAKSPGGKDGGDDGGKGSQKKPKMDEKGPEEEGPQEMMEGGPEEIMEGGGEVVPEVAPEATTAVAGPKPPPGPGAPGPGTPGPVAPGPGTPVPPPPDPVVAPNVTGAAVTEALAAPEEVGAVGTVVVVGSPAGV
ncbi:MAG: hypothetical protein KKE11_07305, partial [Gammaproteobacteria bacterium]|nr:hypothetical protein [Gammaproteobacteria bacterium]